MGNKTELKLLARQQSEQNWTMLPGEEMIPADIANEYNAGVLVLVELDANQQIKKIQDATRHLVGILKNFSRMRDKFRTQEEEIEGWKQSLIYQSQELTRREVDIEARAEELQQLEAESHKIEEQRQEFEETRTQILQLKEEIERDRAQLEEAWGHLHSAQQQFSKDQRASALSDEQVQSLEHLMGQLEGALLTGDTLHQTREALQRGSAQHQVVLQQFWDQIDQGRGEQSGAQADLERQAQELEQAWQQWHQDQETLNQLRSQVQAQQEALKVKQDYKSLLAQHIQVQTELETSLHFLKDGVSGDLQVDIGSLREMPLDALESTVERLRQELKKLSQFVSDQEEELKLQSQTIDELKTKIEGANEYDRMNLSSDLEDEQQNYQLLEETLRGQQHTLRDRNAILKLHQDILNQRKGVVSQDEDSLEKQIEPLLTKVSAQKATLQTSLQALEQELAELQAAAQQAQTQLEISATALTQTQAALKTQSKALEQRRIEVGQIQGRVDTLHQTLQPIQEHLNQWNQSLDSLWSPLESVATQQQQVTQELKQTIVTLGQSA